MKKNLLISMLIAVFALGSFLVAMPTANAAEIYGYVSKAIQSAKKPVAAAGVDVYANAMGADGVVYCQSFRYRPETDDRGFYRLRNCDNMPLHSPIYVRAKDRRFCTGASTTSFDTTSDSRRVDIVMSGENCDRF